MLVNPLQRVPDAVAVAEFVHRQPAPDVAMQLVWQNLTGTLTGRVTRPIDALAGALVGLTAGETAGR